MPSPSSSSSSSSSSSGIGVTKTTAAAVITSAVIFSATAASSATSTASSSFLPSSSSSSSSLANRLLSIRGGGGGKNSNGNDDGRGRRKIMNNNKNSPRRKVPQRPPPPPPPSTKNRKMSGFVNNNKTKNEKAKSSSPTSTSSTTTQQKQQQQSEKEGLAAVLACSLLSVISSLSESSSWLLLRTIGVAILGIVYVIYPISLLMLFRISEAISLVKLFEHSHYCRAYNQWTNCAAVVGIHGIQFFSIVATIMYYRGLVNKKKKQQHENEMLLKMIEKNPSSSSSTPKRRSIITTKDKTTTISATSSIIVDDNNNSTNTTINPLKTILKVWMIILILGVGIFKYAVDDWLLFQLNKPITSARPPPAITNANDSRMKLEGKVAIVTGANRGIGLATAKALVERGATVIMTCRSIIKCQPIVDELNQGVEDELQNQLFLANNISCNNKGGKAIGAVLDLSNLESAVTLSKDLISKYPKIHYVFANAGTTPQYPLTKDGYEDGFGGMHLAHMTLILGLLPSLRNAGGSSSADETKKQPSRVIMVSSEMAINAAIGIFGIEPIFRSGNLYNNDDDVDEEEEGDAGSNHKTSITSLLDRDLQDVHGEYTRGDGTLGTSLPAYGRAKLCNVLFALELNRRMIQEAKEQDLAGPLVIANAVHTGAVATDSSRGSIQNTFRFIPGLPTIVGRIYFPLLWRDVDGGARVLLCAALSDDDYVLKGGQYLDALCHPFLPSETTTTSTNDKQYKGITVSFSPKWEIHTDPIYALMEADRKWSERLWNVSIELLKDSSVAAEVVPYAPPIQDVNGRLTG